MQTIAEQARTTAWAMLYEEAWGRKNAIPGKVIADRLRAKFGPWRNWYHWFQTQVVVPSRRADAHSDFICSCDDGYYIPRTPEDVEPMIRFYRERIEQETTHLRNAEAFQEALSP